MAVGQKIADLSPQLKYVPPRGSLYKDRWHEDDFLKMHADSAASQGEPGTYVSQPGLATGEVTDAVTQRMLSALIEDDAALRLRIGLPSATAEMQQAAHGMSPKVSLQALEKEVRRCVVTLGLLDGPEKAEEDKVMMQLQHQQHTLKLCVEFVKRLSSIFGLQISFGKRRGGGGVDGSPPFASFSIAGFFF